MSKNKTNDDASRSTDMLAKEAIKHIRETDYQKLKGFVPEEEDRITVNREWRKKKKNADTKLQRGRISEWRKHFKDNYKDFADEYAKGEETLRDLCEKYDISIQTFYNLKEEKIEFFEAIKTAQKRRREEKLQMANKGMKILLEGGEYTERKTKAIPTDEGRSIQEVTVQTKRVLPNPTMVIFTLCNLDKENWRHISTIKHEGIPERPPVDLSNLSDEELDEYLELTRKAEGREDENE